MISALAWLPKGAAKPLPKTVEPNAEELAALGSSDEEWEEAVAASAAPIDASTSEDEAADPVRAAKHARKAARALKLAASGESTALAGSLADLNMDAYDDEAADGAVAEMLHQSGAVLSSKDPYLRPGGSDSEDTDAADEVIRPDDLLIIAARNDEESCGLEVWVYEEASGPGDEPNIFVHHDLTLHAFPLSLCWMDLDPHGRADRANMVAVSSFEPGIEIWDLDLLDAYEPVVTLGGESEAASGGSAGARRSKKSKKVVPGSHADAVLSVQWSAEFRNVLGSASADHTVKVWDVSTQQCEHTLTHHSDKVQAVRWNPAEAPVLASAGFDRAACLCDVRLPDTPAARWSISGEAEALSWDPDAPSCFLVAADDGSVVQFDARAGGGSAPLFVLAAHDKPTSSLSFCSAAPHLLATTSTDKQVKLWDIASGAPSLIATEDVGVGAVFTAAFCGGDNPWLLAIGGAKGSVSVWDVRTNAAVAAKYRKQITETGA